MWFAILARYSRLGRLGQGVSAAVPIPSTVLAWRSPLLVWRVLRHASILIRDLILAAICAPAVGLWLWVLRPTLKAPFTSCVTVALHRLPFVVALHRQYVPFTPRQFTLYVYPKLSTRKGFPCFVPRSRSTTSKDCWSRWLCLGSGTTSPIEKSSAGILHPSHTSLRSLWLRRTEASQMIQ